MKTATITFKKCIQDSQEYGSDDEFMVSRIFFDLDINGQKHENLHVNIKQQVGSDFEKSPLEVYRPEGYQGPLNYQAFRQAVEDYYRSIIGSQGRGIHIGSEATNIRMYGNIFEVPRTVQFTVDEKETGW